MKRVNDIIKILVIAIAVIFISSVSYAMSNLEGFILEDNSSVSYDVDLSEDGYIGRVESEGMCGFTIQKITSEGKEVALEISDFEKAKGKKLSPGTYSISPQMCADVPDSKVIRKPMEVQGENIKAYINVIILSPSEAEAEGISVDQ